jgi:hypothetical protein
MGTPINVSLGDGGGATAEKSHITPFRTAEAIPLSDPDGKEWIVSLSLATGMLLPLSASLGS